MSNLYKKYENTQYIILSTGEVARVLKPTAIHKQKYYNLVINKKLVRINAQNLFNYFNLGTLKNEGTGV